VIEPRRERRQRALEKTAVLDTIREKTGIYGLGFRKEAILGLMVPLGIFVFTIIVSVLFFYML